jgi:hypothetical protein
MKKIFHLLTFIFLLGCTSNSTYPWSDFLNLPQHEILLLEVPDNLNRVGIEEIIFAAEGNTITHYGYEASVHGNHASVRIRFRLVVTSNEISHFSVLQHQEHAGFGVILINALEANIVGLSPQLSAIENILQTTAVPNTALTETYDGMIPAIDAMLLHAAEQFA